MGKPLFDPNFVYPSDREGGRYVELDGVVTQVASALGEYWKMTVRNDEHGEHSGFMYKAGSFEPKVGYWARIRVYDAGGGWYPDNRITSCGPLEKVPWQP